MIVQYHLAARLAASAYPGARQMGRGWRDQAQCLKASTSLDDLFACEEHKQREALRVCCGCPAVVDCLAFALMSPFPVNGVWGGTTRWDRTRMVTKALRGHCRNCGAAKDGSAKFCLSCLNSAQVRAR